VTIDYALKKAACEIERRDAMLLMRHVTGFDSSHIMLHGTDLLQNSDEFFGYVNRLKQGEPMQYIIEEWDFMGRRFKTDKRALIPRPETELLVERVLASFIFARDVLAKGSNPSTAPNSSDVGVCCSGIYNGGQVKILDLCTGSGCIAASLARAGDFHVTAADICPHALSLAQENGAGLDVDFIQSDLFSNIHGQFDIIVSNPPYITSAEMQALSPTVRDHEPHLALHGGYDGLDIYRKLIPQSLNFLKPGGALFLEIGPPSVKDLMQGFTNVQLENDYGGLPRIVYGVKENV